MTLFTYQMAKYLKFNNQLSPACRSQFRTPLGGGESWNEGETM